MATMQDVAEKAGVSTTTVSHVINETRYVSPEVTERVRSVMDDLNYQPDVIARSLRRRETMTIGLIIPTTTIPFFAAVAHSIEKAASAAGYNVILCHSKWDLSRDLQHLENLQARRVDGLVCISAEMEAEHITPVVEAGTPVVMFERKIPGSSLDAVGIDNFKGAYMAVEHLLELGHRRIGFIQGLETSTLSSERLDASRQALKDWGIERDPALEQPGDFLEQAGCDGARELLKLDEPPTAIFAFNDMMAIGALQVLHEYGIRVPRDMAVVGFDGISLTKYMSPPLTTIAQPVDELGQRAVSMLLDRIKGDVPDGPRFMKSQPKLVVRASSAGYEYA